MHFLNTLEIFDEVFMHYKHIYSNRLGNNCALLGPKMLAFFIYITWLLATKIHFIWAQVGPEIPKSELSWIKDIFGSNVQWD